MRKSYALLLEGLFTVVDFLFVLAVCLQKYIILANLLKWTFGGQQKYLQQALYHATDTIL